LHEKGATLLTTNYDDLQKFCVCVASTVILILLTTSYPTPAQTESSLAPSPERMVLDYVEIDNTSPAVPLPGSHVLHGRTEATDQSP
jgi:hypothetical protein